MIRHNGHPEFDGACFRLSQVMDRGERISRGAVIDRLLEERRHDPETILASEAPSTLDALRESIGGRCYQCGTPTRPWLTHCQACGSPWWTGVDAKADDAR